MADNKMNLTDAEIKKALECCGNYKCTLKCPMYENGPSDADVCAHQLIKMSIDLINRKDEMLDATIAGRETLQKALAEKNAEIEMLKLEYAGFEAGVKQFAKDGKMVRVKVKEMVGE